MAHNRSDRTTDSVPKTETWKSKLFNVMVALMAGVLGGIMTNLIILNWQASKESTLQVDMLEKRQGRGSLRWNFHLKPERPLVFSRTRLSGVLLHAEAVPDAKGNIPSMDWREFSAIRFLAKSSSKGFLLGEMNVFVGENHVQYMFDHPDEMVLSTEWRQIEIPFDTFRLPPWVPGSDRTLGPRAAQVTALGFDIKNRTLDMQGTVWIDFIRLIRRDGSVVLLSDCDENSFAFEGHALTWFAGARDY